jgi:hypothetical protein
MIGMRPGRLPGRSLIARQQPRAESKEAIMRRAAAKRIAARQVLDGNPARGQSSYAGATVSTSDRVANPRPRRSKPRIR